MTNKRVILKTGLLTIASLWFAGCATTSDQNTPKQPDGAAGVVFAQSIATTQKAAVNSLVVLGCNINKQEPNYVEGFRPNKIGLVVGSGGETLKVWLDAQAPNKTSVRVKTQKSLLGIAGQKNWDDEIIAEMTKVLGK